jgi:hypothetical protein
LKKSDCPSVFQVNKAYLKLPYQRRIGGTLLKNAKGRRSRVVVAVLLPAIIFLWIVGWSLYWIGRQKESREPEPPTAAEPEDCVSLKAIPLEEPLRNQ